MAKKEKLVEQNEEIKKPETNAIGEKFVKEPIEPKEN